MKQLQSSRTLSTSTDQAIMSSEGSSNQGQEQINVQELEDLKERMKLIVEADPKQFHNEYSLKRYLKAFKTPDAAFQAILKTNKWRVEYGVDELTAESEPIKKNADKALILKHRDLLGRPVIYIPTKNYAAERDIDELTKFIVYCLVSVWPPPFWIYGRHK